MRLAHALKWSFGAELASRAIQPIAFIVLARLLVPSDFGVISAAMMVAALAEIFCDAGMGNAVVQRQNQLKEAANAAFWVNLGLGAVVGTLLFFSADFIAREMFHDARVAAVLQVGVVQVLLVALSSVQTALLQKEMAFQKLFWVRFVTVTLPGLASVPLALHGCGYWALVAGSLAGQLAQTVLLWRMSTWRPTLGIDLGVLKDVMRFGFWAAASGVLAWFFMWADSLIVGMYLGSHDLGLYRTGNQFTTIVFAMLLAPVLPVLYSHLSRVADMQSIRKTMELTIRFLVLIGIPIGLALIILAPEIEFLVFGQKWQGIASVVGVLGLMHGIAWTVGMNGEAYRALGRPRIETLVMLACVPLYIGVYLAYVGDGLSAFVASRFAAMVAGLAIQLIVLRHVLRIPLLSMAGFAAKIALTATAALLLGKWVVSGLEMTSFGGGVKVATACAACAAALLLLERNRTLLQIRTFLK